MTTPHQGLISGGEGMSWRRPLIILVDQILYVKSVRYGLGECHSAPLPHDAMRPGPASAGHDTKNFYPTICTKLNITCIILKAVSLNPVTKLQKTRSIEVRQAASVHYGPKSRIGLPQGVPPPLIHSRRIAQKQREMPTLRKVGICDRGDTEKGEHGQNAASPTVPKPRALGN